MFTRICKISQNILHNGHPKIQLLQFIELISLFKNHSISAQSCWPQEDISNAWKTQPLIHPDNVQNGDHEFIELPIKKSPYGIEYWNFLLQQINLRLRQNWSWKWYKNKRAFRVQNEYPILQPSDYRMHLGTSCWCYGHKKDLKQSAIEN